MNGSELDYFFKHWIIYWNENYQFSFAANYFLSCVQFQDLVIRIIFILGNLTAKNNRAREQFFEEQGSIDTLIALFQTYCENVPNRKLWKDGEIKNLRHPSEAEDILIKLIRVIANLSIHPNVGACLATNHHIVALLITVLGKNCFWIYNL